MPTHFGPYSREIQVGQGWQTLIDGLTTDRYVIVKPLSTNRGDVLVRDRTDPGPNPGLRLEPTEPPTRLFLNYDNSRYLVRATLDGNTVTFMTSE